MVKLLVEEGRADIQYNLENAIVWACNDACIDCLKYLIKYKNTNLTPLNNQKLSELLDYAKKEGHKNVVKHLKKCMK